MRYFGFADGDATEPDLEVVIEAGSFGISPPQKWHRIELLTDDTYFNIDFSRILPSRSAVRASVKWSTRIRSK